MAATEPRVEIPFSVEEYQRRLARTRERMRARGVRALVCNEPENIYYLTGYKTIGYYWYQCVLVTEDHDPVIVLRKFEESNVLFGTWSRQLAPYMDYEDPVQTTVQETYVITGQAGSGEVQLNGAMARLAQPGDRVIVMSFASMTPEEADRHHPRVAILDERNRIVEQFEG